MGPDVFQAGCLNTHYDANCTLTPVNVPGTVSSGGHGQQLGRHLASATPDHYFRWTRARSPSPSGGNAGLSRAVKTYAGGGAISVAFPLPFVSRPPAIRSTPGARLPC